MKHLGQLVGLLALAATAIGSAGSPSAACSVQAPTLLASPTAVRPGDAVVVSGGGYLVVDPNPPTTTTSSPDDPVGGCAQVLPAGPVQLVFVQAGLTVPLATVQPNADLQLEPTTVTIPADASSGAAAIVAVGDYANGPELVELAISAEPPVLEPPVVEPDYTG